MTIILHLLSYIRISSPAVVGAQGNGKGIALLPRFIVDEEIAAGRLVEVLSDWTAPQIWLTLYYPPYERLPLRVATFSDFFEAWVRTSNPSESGSGFQ